jgi:hypothetical protein
MRSGSPALVAMLAWVAAFALAGLLAGCGEKIAIPEAQGIPTASLYLEQTPWELTDPTDVLESEGRILVTEGSPGTVTKYTTQQEVQFQVVGLRDPVAMAVEYVDRVLVVGEAGIGEQNGPRLTYLTQRAFESLGSTELEGLVKSLAGVAVDERFVYVSDPDSGVVHRFRWVQNGDLTVQPQGLVCDNQGSIESPQFVFRPSGLSLDEEGMLLICDADTTRNWVLRFDPTPQEEDSLSHGVAVQFRTSSCAAGDVSTYVLGKAPGCDEDFEPGPSAELGALHAPQGVTFDSEGRFYVADSGNQRVQRYSNFGIFNIVFGDDAVEAMVQPVRLVTWDGLTSVEGTQIVIAGARVYIADRGGAQIRVFEDKRWSDLQEGRLQ